MPRKNASRPIRCKRTAGQDCDTYPAIVRNLETVCTVSAEIADGLAAWAREEQEARSARLAIDALQICISAHVLQTRLAHALETEARP